MEPSLVVNIQNVSGGNQPSFFNKLLSKPTEVFFMRSQKMDKQSDYFLYQSFICIFLVLLMLFPFQVMAEQVATITDLNGILSVKKSNGEEKVLSLSSKVDEGDILTTQADTYARVHFIDHTEVVLRPNTQFKIDAYHFEEGKPEKDRSILSLIQGGLRSVTGLLGKRSKDQYKLNTPAATIGIRGTTYIANFIPENTVTFDEYCKKNPDVANTKLQEACKDLKPGLYVEVLEGAILVGNEMGSKLYTIGDVGYTPSSQQAPVVLSYDPNLTFDFGRKLGSLQCRIR